VPFRIDIGDPPADAIDRLTAIGALDIDLTDTGIAAILPDRLTPSALTEALGVTAITISAAIGRDDESTWIVQPRPRHAGGIWLLPESAPPRDGGLRLHESDAFGTGCHPTTVLCLEAMTEAMSTTGPDRVLDVGTGTGILALAALVLGVPHAVGVDVDPAAIEAAAANARLNGLEDRLELVPGDAAAVSGVWPLIVANVLAAPLMEMSRPLVQRLGHRGVLVLSGITRSLESEVERVYRRCGVRLVRSESRHDWSVLIFEAPW
jgi:ribosomal protein L11 methyltransferase